MATQRRAEVTWSGSLEDGSGVVERVGSGSLRGLPVSWSARAGEPNGQTSPEELIAAAHAACFSMALSGGLARAGAPPERLATAATVTFQPGEGITRIDLEVAGTVSGIDEDGFREAAEAAKAGCPVSRALAGVPEITVSARLEG